MRITVGRKVPSYVTSVMIDQKAKTYVFLHSHLMLYKGKKRGELFCNLVTRISNIRPQNSVMRIYSVLDIMPPLH